jgi:hypothetical protein
MKDLVRAQEVVNRIAEIKDKLESHKPLYEELDDLIGELADVAEVNQTLATNDGRFITSIDNFAEKNTVWRPAAVKHFDILMETKEELDKRTAAAAKKAAKAAKGASE